jgi:hypothetical protein
MRQEAWRRTDDHGERHAFTRRYATQVSFASDECIGEGTIVDLRLPGAVVKSDIAPQSYVGLHLRENVAASRTATSVPLQSTNCGQCPREES